ncbi:SGNH/GDSL hydrolase family protein [Streptomyces sp. 3MP-14]|uniref:SGNH/GDSL hydrolase family protein n=1 Tax=Streptomyces mimosae TaxID=2586635 RepID=A0A5N6APT4_9ACTN|nr:MULTISPECIES: SGNH/GDSL hydrolase family protein [Streptomyces]KAB8170857.1 SGNH/GDSL hydrolase family protein [Streptomyces mimosae]KAB8179791.1 SGNH/GDSL hydrolase family protein [Streptomyces sp. 3MP-14]
MTVHLRAALASLTLSALLLGCTSSGQDAGQGAERDSETESDRGSSEGEAGAAEEEGPVWNTEPASIAAMGDSITRGFDACALLADCPEASWATGTDSEVDSLARQLLGDDVAVAERSWNLAASGAVMADLPAQAADAVALEPELVTVLIGANDACATDVAQMTEVAEFRADFAAALGVIRAELPETGVYVASVPDLERLWSEGQGSTLARTIWRLANVCPSMLADADEQGAEATERRAEVSDRVRAYNEALAEVCARDALCRYDGGAVYDYAFTADHISDWDWFHPSRQGQSTLAALAYEQVTMDAVE